MLGYAAWRRGEGYDETSTIEVDDLLATSADAYRALWRVIGSFSTVTGRVRLSTSGDDPARLLLPGGSWKVVGTHPYALRLLDVERAFGLRPPAGAAAGATELSFTVAGDTLGHLDGGYRLRVADGATTCERGTADGPTFTPQGARAGLGRGPVLREPADARPPRRPGVVRRGARRAAGRRPGARPRLLLSGGLSGGRAPAGVGSARRRARAR